MYLLTTQFRYHFFVRCDGVLASITVYPFSAQCTRSWYYTTIAFYAIFSIRHMGFDVGHILLFLPSSHHPIRAEIFYCSCGLESINLRQLTTCQEISHSISSYTASILVNIMSVSDKFELVSDPVSDSRMMSDPFQKGSATESYASSF